MRFLQKIKRNLRGNVALAHLVREAFRQSAAKYRRLTERREIEVRALEPARLTGNFAELSAAELAAHFRTRTAPSFWPDGLERMASLQRSRFPAETDVLLAAADRIVERREWELAGFGLRRFDRENAWRCDPLTGEAWGLEYHGDVAVHRPGGPDIRVLWELNRFGHVITLARAFAVTADERFAETYFDHVQMWAEQNPYGRGANWQCAMEVALRAVNLLAAFDIFRRSAACTPPRVAMILKLFDQHGRFTLDNNEFTYIVTSNHYMSDVVGLFWLGTMLPELEHASQWREFGLSEMLREMKKQVLADGADFEASSLYHRFVTEMLLVSFVLAERNRIPIDDKYLDILRSMVEYLAGIAEPDGRMPVIGDCDGSQFLPIVKRSGEEAKFLLDVAAAICGESEFKVTGEPSPEVLWLCGRTGLDKFDSLPVGAPRRSGAFHSAGSYLLRSEDLYLHFNAGDCGVNGRGSHTHNDALSIEVAAFGRPFIVDPGSYCYNLDHDARHQFRSTGYHSTVVIDGAEQNSIEPEFPFVSGNEASPRMIEWQITDDVDVVVAEHYGYDVIHRREAALYKTERFWRLTDSFSGSGQHEYVLSFHVAANLAIEPLSPGTVAIVDGEHGSIILDTDATEAFEVIDANCSTNYGHRDASRIVRWRVRADAPLSLRSLLIAAAAGEDLVARLEKVRSLHNN